MLVFVLQWLSLHWEILIMLLSQFPLTFQYTQNRIPRFIAWLMTYDLVYDYDWDGFCDHFRDVPWEDIFKLSASAAASEFCEWFQDGIDVSIPHLKSQVKPHSSPRFSAAFGAAIVHKITFFCFYQQNKSSESKVKFRQDSNRCKRVLEAAKLAMLLKQKSPSFPRNLALGTFGELLIVFSAKVNLYYTSSTQWTGIFVFCI